jgi:hypothetical protein
MRDAATKLFDPRVRISWQVWISAGEGTEEAEDAETGSGGFSAL